MSDMSIDKYCKNPIEYKNLPQKTIKYYNNICDTRKQIDSDWNKLIKKAGATAEEIPVAMLNSIFSPQGLEMIGIFEGVKITSKVAINGLLRGIARGVGPEVMEAASALAAEEGAMYVNNAILQTVVGIAVQEAVEAEMAYRALTLAIDLGTELLAGLAAVQMLSMIIDIWDPAGYSKELNADSLSTMVTSYNYAFASQYLNDDSSGYVDEFGNSEPANIWPVEFYADMDREFQQINKDKYNYKFWTYSVEYTKNLKINSNGELIIWPKAGNVLDNNWFTKFSKNYSIVLADKNTVVANFIDRYLIILMVIIVIIIIILLLIK